MEFQEYPVTSQYGTASIYNISGWDIKEATNIFKLHNIQYSLGNPGKISEVCCKFLGVKCPQVEKSNLTLVKLLVKLLLNFRISKFNQKFDKCSLTIVIPSLNVSKTLKLY